MSLICVDCNYAVKYPLLGLNRKLDSTTVHGSQRQSVHSLSSNGNDLKASKETLVQTSLLCVSYPAGACLPNLLAIGGHEDEDAPVSHAWAPAMF